MTKARDIARDMTIRVSSTAVSTAIPGETVILDPTSGRYFGLDGVGSRVWDMLQEPTTVAAIVAAITSEFDVDEATCERDLRALLEDLEAKGLVAVGDAKA